MTHTGLGLQSTYTEKPTCSRYTSLRTYASRHVYTLYKHFLAVAPVRLFITW